MILVLIFSKVGMCLTCKTGLRPFFLVLVPGHLPKRLDPFQVQIGFQVVVVCVVVSKGLSIKLN